MQNTLPGILVNATRIVVSKFVGLETTRRIQMRMKTEDPGAPEPTPCLATKSFLRTRNSLRMRSTFSFPSSRRK